MSVLIVLFVFVIWVFVLYQLGYWVFFFVKKIGLRRLAALGFMAVMFLLPIADEIIGEKQFRELCLNSNELKFEPTIAGRKYDLAYKTSLTVLLNNYAIPIQEYSIEYTDKNTGNLVATGKTYIANGGWLVRTMGGHPMGMGDKPVFISENSCYFHKEKSTSSSRIRALINGSIN